MIPDQWYPVLRSATVGATPFAARRFGRDLVFWRDAAGHLHCMDDRCPHKGVRLSHGRVSGDRIQCAYHGFEYGGSGRCEVAPCLGRATRPPKSLRVEVVPTREHWGMVWAWYGEAREVLPPLPLFPEFEDMDLVWHTVEWVFPGHYTRYLESLTESHHIPFVHTKLSFPIPDFLVKTRLFSFLEYGTGDYFETETLVDNLEVWTEDHILRSTYDVRPDDGTSFEESPGHHYEIHVGLPCMIGASLPLTGLHAFVTCTPIDDDNTWVAWRYMFERSAYPRGVAKLLAVGSTIAERYFAQPQDWPLLADQTPNIATPSARRLVASDRLNALYLKRRDELIRAARKRAASDVDTPIRIDEARGPRSVG